MFEVDIHFLVHLTSLGEADFLRFQTEHVLLLAYPGQVYKYG